jgi:hypothetical protein
MLIRFPPGFSAAVGEYSTPDPQEHLLLEAHTRPDPSLVPIERPRCPECQGRMMLARIEPGPNGSDLPTFECSKCEHVHRVLAEDPMKSAKAQWHYNNLNSPT